MSMLAEQVLVLIGARVKVVQQPLPYDDSKQRRRDISLAKEMRGWEANVEMAD